MNRPRTTIRITVVTVFVVATIITAAVAIGLQYHFSESLGRRAAAELYTATAESIAGELEGIRRVNSNVIELLSRNRELSDPRSEGALLLTFVEVLKNNPLFYGIYVGRQDGSFYEVVNLDTGEHTRDHLMALPSDRWVVVTVNDTPEGLRRHYQYLGAKLQMRASREEATDFNVTERPWYRAAIESDKVESTDPYLFAQSGEPGRTMSRRLAGAAAVVGIDMTLGTMSDFLASRQIAADSSLYLFRSDGLVIASNERKARAADAIPLPAFEVSARERDYLDSLGTLTVSNEMDWPPIDYAVEGEPSGYSVDLVRLLARMLGVEIRFENGYSWPELVKRFRAGEIDILQSVAPTAENHGIGLLGDAYFSLPYALLTREDSEPPRALGELGDRPVAIPAAWSILPLVRKAHPQLRIIEADSTLDAIQKVVSGEAYAALDNEVILRYVSTHYFVRGTSIHPQVDLGLTDGPDTLHLLVGRQRGELNTLLNRAIAAIGLQQRAVLEHKWLDYDGGKNVADSETVPTPALVDIAGDPGRYGRLATTTIDDREYVVYVNGMLANGGGGLLIGILTPMETVLHPYLEKVSVSIAATAGFLLLLLPLSWLFANPIVRPVKQLAAENDKVRRLEFDQVQRIPSHVRELDELSESMVQMVASIRAHERAQRELIDAIIRLIAQAIDDKSAYTGGHCERVPELALMLARAANDSDDPAFSGFRLENEAQWREYRIAAWLHDCGKITTPEHIVDKGSKLETIYNRIHEVRMRFEVLSRDAELDYWERLQAHPEQKPELEAGLEQKQRELQDDFAFVAECNVGGEFLDESKLQRLLQIAETTWQRRFDDRLGLSPVEELRLRGEPAPLPATEKLLADKPEHIIERTGSTDYPPEFGIRMDVPEHLYNLGEIYNLSVSRGTLTAEDRFKINEHMISTIKMLEALPLPAELHNVPRYASTHHETMKGTGYPRRLPGEALSIPERILAVADVFEALTASDRPYKKAKPVSVALDILQKMVEDNHIDRDCFELFLRSGVYRQYAERFLQPDQIDEVDVQRYLA